eukprot:2823599-Prymnesium_polylepis.1
MRAGTVIDLEGRAIFINQINCQLASDGTGALLNAQHRSRLFEVIRGANLSLYSVTLSNGQCAALTFGGSIRIVGACLTLSHGSAIVNSTSEQSGGAILLMQGASVVLTAGSYISNSTCQNMGGAVHIVHGNFSLTDASWLSLSSGERGGAISAECYGVGVIRILLNSSSIIDSRAKYSGGAVWMADACGHDLVLATLQLVNSSLINSACTGSDLFLSGGNLGGAICAFGGHLTLEGGSTITTSQNDADTGSRGGAIFMGVLARLVMAERSSIIHSTSGRGGAIFVRGGSAHITDGSSIVNSSATFSGGAIVVTKGGKVRVEESSIVNASLRALGLRGGVFQLRHEESTVQLAAGQGARSELHLVTATVRSSVVAFLHEIHVVKGFMLSIAGASGFDVTRHPP